MSLDQMEVRQKASIESVKKSNKVSILMESKNKDGGVFLCPVTPCLTKESVKLTSLNLNDDDDGYVDQSTPVKDVVDASASGSNQMNYPGTAAAARKLDFGCDECVSENKIEHGSLVETMYESVLEAIICDQAEDILTEVLAPDEAGTPPSVARLTRLAETCPGAPLKPKQVGRSKIVSTSLCRRLDFDSYV